MTWLNIYTSSYHHRIIIIKSEIWIIAQCLRLGHEIMVCAVCLTRLLWKHFLTSGPLCWESTRDQYSLQREPLLQGLDVVFPVCLIKPLDKQSSEQWNEIPELLNTHVTYLSWWINTSHKICTGFDVFCLVGYIINYIIRWHVIMHVIMYGAGPWRPTWSFHNGNDASL